MSADITAMSDATDGGPLTDLLDVAVAKQNLVSISDDKAPYLRSGFSECLTLFDAPLSEHGADLPTSPAQLTEEQSFDLLRLQFSVAQASYVCNGDIAESMKSVANGDLPVAAFSAEITTAELANKTDYDQTFCLYSLQRFKKLGPLEWAIMGIAFCLVSLSCALERQQQARPSRPLSVLPFRPQRGRGVAGV